ncbi:unnamed protein product [Polarella glacialis]|uniref:Uncharacterized protein n=1 Tax=Polarella glacialis TaxID=89957 RepID=A0A813FR96_POLGL|nr:unnamed protein product [Polarella glacialis]
MASKQDPAVRERQPSLVEEASVDSRNLDLEKALQNSPIRTRYVPRRDRSKSQDTAEHGLNAQLDDFSQRLLAEYGSFSGSEIIENTPPGLMRRAMTKMSMEANVIKEAAHELKETTKRGEATGSKSIDTNYSAIMKMVGVVEEVTAEHGLTGTSLKKMATAASLAQVKSETGLATRERTNEFRVMLEAGKFFCGAQDPALKRVGLKKTERKAEEEGSSGSSDFEERDETLIREKVRQKKAVFTLEDDMEIYLQATKAGTVARRTPEAHEAVFDFNESRISMPKYLSDSRAGQLVTIAPKLHPVAGGMMGQILVKTMAPIRLCNEKSPTELANIMDLKTITAASGTGVLHDRTAPITRKQTGRQAPNVKDWEAWREIQRQKCIDEKNKVNQHLRGVREGAGKGDGEGEDGAAAMDRRAESKFAIGENGERTARKAIRQKVEKGFISELILPPWDARPPPDSEEVQRLLAKLGLDEATTMLAAGHPSMSVSQNGTTGTFESRTRLRKNWMLKATGAKTFRLAFQAAMVPPEEDEEPGEAIKDKENEDFWQAFFVRLYPEPFLQRLLGWCGVTSSKPSVHVNVA